MKTRFEIPAHIRFHMAAEAARSVTFLLDMLRHTMTAERDPELAASLAKSWTREIVSSARLSIELFETHAPGEGRRLAASYIGTDR